MTSSSEVRDFFAQNSLVSCRLDLEAEILWVDRSDWLNGGYTGTQVSLVKNRELKKDCDILDKDILILNRIEEVSGYSTRFFEGTLPCIL